MRHADELSYAEFVVRYMAPNVPVVIQVGHVHHALSHVRQFESSCCLQIGGLTEVFIYQMRRASHMAGWHSGIGCCQMEA